MILDALARLSNAQALTAGTTVSTDKYDLGAVTPRRDIGAGEPMAIAVTVDVAAAGSTDTTAIRLVSDEDAALGSPTIHLSRTIANALLVAGALIVIPIPQGPQPYERYLGLSVVLGSGDTVTLSAYIVPQSSIPFDKHYASAIVIE